MNPFESDLARLANTIETDSAHRVMDGVNRSVRSQRRKRASAFIVGVAAAATIYAAAVNYGPATSQQPQAGGPAPATQRDTIGGVEPGEPCPGAIHAESTDALKTDVRIWAPANTEMKDAWTCGGTPVVLYGAIQISYELGWEDVDAAKKWEALARDYGGSIQTIHDRPAYVHPADDAGPRGEVMFVADGQLVRLLANKDVPIEDLLTLANEIKLPPKLDR